MQIKKSHEGLFREDVGVAPGEPIPMAKVMAKMHSESPAVRKRANFARMAKRHFKPIAK